MFASKRNQRPDQFGRHSEIKKVPKKDCIFETPKKAAGEGVILASYPDEKNWRLKVIPNKYPAVVDRSEKAKVKKRGPFSYIEGYGNHEVIITKDHNKNFSQISLDDAILLFSAFKDRYEEVSKDKNSAYISMFHNWGERAGASIYHPHYQILSTPVVPLLASRSISHARTFKRKRRKCLHCYQIDLAKKDGKRVIHEDEFAIAFAPYAPEEPFEFRVAPKSHSPYFDQSSEYEIYSMVKTLQISLQKLEKTLKEVNYNFYFHTTPIENKKGYKFYHWHIQVVPRLNISAGFELTTGIEVNPVFPEDAVKMLKETK